MANKLLRTLQIHGLDYNTGNVVSMNEDNSFNFVDENDVEYFIYGTEIKVLGKTKNTVKKPRGWHMKPIFTDSEGNVYIKGVLSKK